MDRVVSEEVGRHRATLYLNQERVKADYIRLGGIDRLDVVRNRDHGIQAGLPKWLAEFAVRISSTRGEIAQTQISEHPELMGLLLEVGHTLSGDVLELSLHPSPVVQQDRKPTFLKYVGPSYLTRPGYPLLDSHALRQSDLIQYYPNLRQTVEDEHAGQQQLMREVSRDEEETMAVWIAEGVRADGVAYERSK